MQQKNPLLQSFPYAAGTFLYIAGVAWLMSHLGDIFGPEEPSGLLAPLLMLTLFVVSAATTGSLVLGKPIHLYLQGARGEAFMLLGATIGWLALFAFLVALRLLAG
jgi:hypothetical protein